MKKVLISLLALVLLCGGVIGAEGKATWHKDKRLVIQWVMSDQTNVGKWIDWCAENLTQAQIDSLETMMFPDVPDDQKGMALEMIKMQMQQFSLERSDDPSIQSALKALESAIAESKKEKKDVDPSIPAIRR